MKRSFAFACLSGLLALSVSAARFIGFEADAFNRSCPADSPRNFVFSPASFELDCVLVAESLPTIPKANVSEMMGVVIDFESTFRPMIDGLSERTNGFSFVAARGFCVPDMRTARIDHRLHLSRAYGAEVLRSTLPHGAERWFRATMEGDMESFSLPVAAVGANAYSFYDLVSLRAAWRDPFPTENTRTLSFRGPGESNAVQVVCMSDVRIADTWDTEKYTLLKLPLRGDAWFYALLPKEGRDLADARADVNSGKFAHLLNVTKSVTENGVAQGPCAIVLPRLDLLSRSDLTGLLQHFRIPLAGLTLLAGDGRADECVQHVRFRLAEHAWDEPPLVKKPADSVVPITSDVRRLVFNRPFVFFIYHEKSESVLVAGQFTGQE